MKRLSKLLISFLVVSIFSLSSITFAYSALVDGSKLVTKNDTEDKALIKSKGISDELLNQLGSDSDVVASTIRSNNLNDKQVKNIVNGLTNKKFDKGIKKTPVNGMVELNGQKIAVPDITEKYKDRALKTFSTVEEKAIETHTGAHYIVESLVGYNKVTGFAKLPTCYIAPGTTDTPYQIFGAFTSSSGADTGIYTKDNKNWYIAINMGGINWDSDNADWVSGTTPINRTLHPTVYLLTKVLNNSIEIHVFDAVTFDTITSMSYYAPSRGFNANGTGVRLLKEHALAYLKGTGDLSSGSYVHNSKWSNVNIYSNYGYDLWKAKYTDIRYKADTSAEKRTITILNSIQDYEDEVNIDFNL